MSRSTSWVFPDGATAVAPGHLLFQLGQECPPPRLLIQRKETGPVDPRHNSLHGARGPRSRHDIGQTRKGISR